MASILPRKRKVLVNTFFDSQLNDCPLLWIFCSRSLNHNVNRLHERSLRIAYNDYTATFEDLLAKAKTVTIHQRNLRVLTIEMCKIANGLSPAFRIELIANLGNQRSTRSNCKVTIDEKENITCSNQVVSSKRELQLFNCVNIPIKNY